MRTDLELCYNSSRGGSEGGVIGGMEGRSVWGFVVVNRDIKIGGSFCRGGLQFEGVAAEDVTLQIDHPCAGFFLELLVGVVVGVEFGQFASYSHFSLIFGCFILFQQSAQPFNALSAIILAVGQTGEGVLLRLGQLRAYKPQFFPLRVEFLFVFGELSLSEGGVTVRYV